MGQRGEGPQGPQPSGQHGRRQEAAGAQGEEEDQQKDGKSAVPAGSCAGPGQSRTQGRPQKGGQEGGREIAGQGPQGDPQKGKGQAEGSQQSSRRSGPRADAQSADPPPEAQQILPAEGGGEQRRQQEEQAQQGANGVVVPQGELARGGEGLLPEEIAAAEGVLEIAHVDLQHCPVPVNGRGGQAVVPVQHRIDPRLGGGDHIRGGAGQPADHGRLQGAACRGFHRRRPVLPGQDGADEILRQPQHGGNRPLGKQTLRLLGGGGAEGAVGGDVLHAAQILRQSVRQGGVLLRPGAQEDLDLGPRLRGLDGKADPGPQQTGAQQQDGQGGRRRPQAGQQQPHQPEKLSDHGRLTCRSRAASPGGRNSAPPGSPGGTHPPPSSGPRRCSLSRQW